MSKTIFDKFLRMPLIRLYLEDKNFHISEKDKRKNQVLCLIQTNRWPYGIYSVV